MRIRINSLTALACTVILGLPGCGGDDHATPPADTTPPARITDLRAVVDDESTAVLSWTAPGDDDKTGTAYRYDLRWAPVVLIEETWGTGTACPGAPEPGAAGTGQTHRVSGLPCGSTTQVMIRTADEANNWSPVSNAARVDLPESTPRCSVSTTSLDFDRTLPGQVRSLAFTITNLAGGSLEGAVEGGTGDFVIVAGGGPFHLGYQQNLPVTIRFSPLSPGQKSAVIRTGILGCGEVTCSGVGGGPYCLVQPDTLDFGDVGVYGEVTLPIVLTNLGDELLTGQVGFDCARFFLAGSEQIHLRPNDSTAILVRFAPVSEGPASCIMYVHTQDPHQVFCRGNGVGPRCWMSADGRGFGPVAVGTSVAWPIRIQNHGGGVLNGAISGTCPDFPIVSGGGAFALRQGEERVVTVAFAPTSGGEKTCTIETGSDLCYDVSLWGTGIAGICLLEPDRLDFGLVQVGASVEREFTIRNTAEGLLSGSVALACSEFSLTAGGGSFSLQNGQSRTVRVRCTPLTAGDKSCTVAIGSACGDAPLRASASGQLCRVDPVSLDFGDVPAWGSAERSFTITNVGAGANLQGSVSEACPRFSFVQGGGTYLLSPGGQREVVVRFNPDVAGPYECPINLGAASCPSVVATGTGLGTICEITPSSVVFPRTRLGADRDTVLVVRNVGGGALGGEATLSCPGFSIVSGGGFFFLENGQSRDIRLRWDPQEAGASTCDLIIGSTCAPVPLAGECYDPPPICEISEGALSFGIATIGHPGSVRSFTIRNAGGQRLIGTVSESSPDFEITFGGGPFALRGGEAWRPEIRFTPTAVGTRHGVTDLGASDCPTVACEGSGVSYQVSAQLEHVDDIAKLWINDRLAYTAKFGKFGTEQRGWVDIGHYPGDSGSFDITADLVPGANRVRFTLENTACCGATVTIWLSNPGGEGYQREFVGDGHRNGVLLDETVTVEAGVE